MTDVIAQQLHITGRVQGVGFRPFVYRLANKCQLSGNIKNCGSHVDILIQGNKENIKHFLSEIHQTLPSLAKIEKLAIKKTTPTSNIKSFVIEKSLHHKSIKINPLKDYAVCETCLTEFNDPNNRRFQYAFISCTNCGPRYSISRHFPLDRKNTSFSKFPPCQQCQNEYNDAENRRFHAQNISCPICGPKLTISGHDEIRQHCINPLLAGAIVCIKGTSAYRLYCDATNKMAVAKLRNFKHRPDKPFAVIYPSNDDLRLAKKDLSLHDKNLDFLQKTTRAIVLVPEKKSSQLAENVAPNLTMIGIMLPASGFEHLLLNNINRPLVATSANLSGESIIGEATVAEKKLSHLCHTFIHHNLDIQHALDDSVFKVRPNNTLPIRLSRAYAPHEYPLPFVLDEPVLAFGSQTKNTITLAWKNRAIISQHLGDMHNFNVWKTALKQIESFQKMFGVEVRRYLVDAHPAYTAHQWVKNNKLSYNKILHHHAHASALFFEYQPLAPLLVFTWDGTGYGDNGLLWGGETFYGSPSAWVHVASIKPFKLPSGEKAIKEPWRIAASLCWQAGQNYAGKQKYAENLRNLWQTNTNCPLSSSVGRLFDAAAVLLGLLDIVSYDGQAAMQLEAMATCNTTDFVKPTIKETLFDWQPLFLILQDISLTVAYRATVFHNSLAHLVLHQTILLSEKYEFDQVGLTGGVFQNSLLTSLSKGLLIKQGYSVLLNKTLPANDASISLGQVMEYGMRKIG